MNKSADRTPAGAAGAAGAADQKAPEAPKRSFVASVLGTRDERLAEAQPPRLARFVAYVLFFALGFAVSVCGSFVQALWPPVGVVLALGASAATFYAGLRVTGTRLGAVLPAAGWFAALIILIMPRPEGDTVLWPGDTSLAWMFAGSILGVICATLPTRASWFPGVPNPPR